MSPCLLPEKGQLPSNLVSLFPEASFQVIEAYRLLQFQLPNTQPLEDLHKASLAILDPQHRDGRSTVKKYGIRTLYIEKKRRKDNCIPAIATTCMHNIKLNSNFFPYHMILRNS